MRLVYATLFLAILVSLGNSQQAEKTQPTSRSPEAGLIVLNVTVTTSNSIAVGLDKTAFAVYDNNVLQEITFFDDQDVPLSVAIIYDMSGSMAVNTGDRRIQKTIQNGLARFIQSSNPSNEYFLIGFNQKVEILSDWTKDGNTILSKIMDKRLTGQSVVFDSCYMGVEKLMREGRQKRVLLLISDGLDNNSNHKFGELRQQLKESDVMVYAIGGVVKNDAASDLGLGGMSILDELAVETGGRLYVPRESEDLIKIVEQIALELRHQYRVGYKSISVNDDKWHSIKIKAKPYSDDSGKVRNQLGRSRRGYFACSRLSKPDSE